MLLDSTTPKRVRRELRELSNDAWNRVVAAIWVMKKTSDKEGVKKYGLRYLSYDSLLRKHIIAALDAKGDQGHFGPVFGLYHRAWLLTFENSLLAVDPLIEALPYWSYARDVTPLSNSYESIFSSNYMGSYIGKGSKYAVNDGKFALFPISNKTAGTIVTQSPYGYLRHPLSVNKSPYVTRKGGTICGYSINVGSTSAWTSCLGVGGSIMDWTSCVDGRVHGPAHSAIAGSWRRKSQFSDSDYCANWYGIIAAPSNPLTSSSYNRPYQLGTFIHAHTAGCFSCPKCTMDKKPDECMCAVKSRPCGPLWTNLVKLANTNIVRGFNTNKNQYKVELTSASDIQVMGDFGDPAGSPNDPM